MTTSKTQIKKVLRTQNVTEIFKLAAKNGVDTSNKVDVLNFIRANSPSQKVSRNAYDLSVGAEGKKNGLEYRMQDLFVVNMPVKDTLAYAKQQKKQGESNYSKKLIEGNNNIYWASPRYGHLDYNKSIAMKNDKKGRKIMNLINDFLKF